MEPSEAAPQFLEPTPKRLRALAWAFAWRYHGCYALCFYVLTSLFSIKISDSSPAPFALLLFVFYAGKGIPEAVIKTLYYRPIQGFKMVLVVKDKIISPNSTAWSAYFNPVDALTPFVNSIGISRSPDRFATPDRFFVTLMFIYISCFVAFSMFFPKGDIRMIGGYAQLAILPPVIGYVLSYYAFRRALHHNKGKGYVRLIALDAKAEADIFKDFTVASNALPRDVLQISWAFLWRYWMTILGFGMPLFAFFFFALYFLNIKPDIEWIKAPHHQLQLWLAFVLMEWSTVLFVFKLMTGARFGNFVLRYHYDGCAVEKKDVTLHQWVRVHLPFLVGYTVLSFAFWQIREHVAFSIENDALDTLSSLAADMLRLYLLFAALIQFGCMKTRYVILRKAPKDILQ